MVRTSGPVARELPLLRVPCETISMKKGDTDLSKLTLPEEPPPDNPDRRVAGVEDGESKPVLANNKSYCYIFVMGEEFEGKCDGLIGRDLGLFFR